MSARSDEIHLSNAADKARHYTASRDDQIRTLRGRGYSLRALADLTDLSHTAIANICRKG